MKTKYFTLILSVLIGTGTFAQNSPKDPCVTYSSMDQVFQKDPEAKLRYDKAQVQLWNNALLQKQTSQAGKSAAPVYTVPVVFHILHEGGSENISDALVTAALDQVNKDFARQGTDVNQVAAPFYTLYINSDIKFVLANRDPNGNCTNGIVHRYDSRTNWTTSGSSYSGITWNPTQYLNVIIVKSIDGGQSGIIGYTWLPGTWVTGAPEDAIVYDSGFLSGLNARDLSHEIGHWLNLPHTFGSTNSPGQVCGDDGIADTPPTKGTFGCPSSLSGNVCNGGGTDNVQNFMNYSSCPRNFTTDQTNVMRSTLASPVVGRNNLSSVSNLTFTGISNPSSCAPIAEFMSTTKSYTVCAGSSLTMKDYSYNAPISTYLWAASGASVAAPSATITSITFTNPGISTVSLTVSNPQGSNTKTLQVTVLNPAAVLTSTFTESFEGLGVPANWTVVNPDGGTDEWQPFMLAGQDGTSSFFIDGSTIPANQKDYLEMPILDALNNQGSTLSFWYAYARSTNSNNDLFELQGSTNCGNTWQTIFSLSAANLAQASAGVDANPLVPSPSHWAFYNITNHPNWSAYSNSSSVKLRFMFQEDVNGSGYGNRMFIDRVNLGDPNGVNELTKQLRLQLYPNPTSGSASVNMTLSDPSSLVIKVLDLLGCEIMKVVDQNLEPGAHSFEINTSNELKRGVYFVSISVNGSAMCRKLIVE